MIQLNSFQTYQRKTPAFGNGKLPPVPNPEEFVGGIFRTLAERGLPSPAICITPATEHGGRLTIEAREKVSPRFKGWRVKGLMKISSFNLFGTPEASKKSSLFILEQIAQFFEQRGITRPTFCLFKSRNPQGLRMVVRSDKPEKEHIRLPNRKELSATGATLFDVIINLGIKVQNLGMKIKVNKAK